MKQIHLVGWRRSLLLVVRVSVVMVAFRDSWQISGGGGGGIESGVWTNNWVVVGSFSADVLLVGFGLADEIAEADRRTSDRGVAL